MTGRPIITNELLEHIQGHISVAIDFLKNDNLDLLVRGLKTRLAAMLSDGGIQIFSNPVTVDIRKSGLHIKFDHREFSRISPTQELIPWLEIKNVFEDLSGFDTVGGAKLFFLAPELEKRRVFGTNPVELLADFLTLKIFIEAGTKSAGLNPSYLLAASKNDLGASLTELRAKIELDKETLIEKQTFYASVFGEATERDEQGRAGQENSSKSEIGSVIDGWTLRKVLGTGGFGKVFLAEQKIDGIERSIAIKTLHPIEGESDETYEKRIRRFLSEATTSLELFDSHYVVTAIDFGEKPCPHIFYPLLEGDTVHEVVKNGHLFVSSSWWNLAHDVIAGLAEIDSQGITHRDLHANNIMVLDDRAAIIDMGLSTYNGYEFQGVAGVPGFIAPELMFIGDASQTDISSDIFSAGVILFYAGTGRLPWEFPQTDMATRAWLENVAFDSVDFSGLAGEQVAVLEKMLTLSPADRASIPDLLSTCRKNANERRISIIEKEFEYLNERPDPFPPGRDANFTEIIIERGPWSDWTELKGVFTELLNTHRPEKFIIDFQITSGERLFMQGLVHPTGWDVEGISDRHSSQKHTREQRYKFMEAGYSPPTTRIPNYRIMLDGAHSTANKLFDLMSATIDHCYQISMKDILNVSIQITGKGYFDSDWVS